MNVQYESKWWKATVPRNWTICEDDVCVTFKSQITAVAIQVSAAMKEVGPVTDTDLKEFAGKRASNRHLKIVETTKLKGFHVEYVDVDILWREWWLRSGNLMLYVTYNGERSSKDIQRDAIDGIINSLEGKSDPTSHP